MNFPQHNGSESKCSRKCFLIVENRISWTPAYSQMTPSLVKEIFWKTGDRKKRLKRNDWKEKEMAPLIPSPPQVPGQNPKPKTQNSCLYLTLVSTYKLCMLASFSLVHSTLAAGSDLHLIGHGDSIFLLASHALRYVCGRSFLSATFGINQGCMCHSAIALCFNVGLRDGYTQGLSFAFCCN